MIHILWKGSDAAMKVYRNDRIKKHHIVAGTTNIVLIEYFNSNLVRFILSQHN